MNWLAKTKFNDRSVNDIFTEIHNYDSWQGSN